MENNRLFNSTYQFLGKALDISARRHNLIATNIANLDTVGYKPKDLDFLETLKKAYQSPPTSNLTVSNPRHIDGTEELPDPYEEAMSGTRYDDTDLFHLDSVNIDREMSNLVENNIKFRTTTEMMLRKMAILRHAIAEGGR